MANWFRSVPASDDGAPPSFLTLPRGVGYEGGRPAEQATMKIGITYDLKSDSPLPSHLPDDYQEEFDSPVTIDAIAAVLEKLGHQTIRLGNGKEMVHKVIADP